MTKEFLLTSRPGTSGTSGTNLHRSKLKPQFFDHFYGVNGGGGRETKTSVGNLEIHPWSWTWNLKINPWKRRFLLETIIFRFHVKLWGCNENMTTSVSGPMGSSKHDLVFGQVKWSRTCVEWMVKTCWVRPYRFGHMIYIDSQLGSWNGCIRIWRLQCNLSQSHPSSWEIIINQQRPQIVNWIQIGEFMISMRSKPWL